MSPCFRYRFWFVIQRYKAAEKSQFEAKTTTKTMHMLFLAIATSETKTEVAELIKSLTLVVNEWVVSSYGLEQSSLMSQLLGLS